MKALQLANGYFGTSLYVSLFNALSKVGVENIIYVPTRKNENVRNTNDRLSENNGTSLVVNPCFNTLDRILFFSKQKKILNGIRQTVEMGDISCVHAHTLFSAGYTAMKLKEEYNTPYITAVRNTDVNVFFKKMKHLRGIGVNILKNADRVIFLSPAYKKNVIKTYVPEALRYEIEKKSVVIPNGISSCFFQNAPDFKTLDENNLGIIYAGEINKNKNLIETINACKMLLNKGHPCRFTIVGDITDKACKKLINEIFVTHYPRCGHDELIMHYRANDIFVMPSHKETFGLVYAEAMSQGLPIIYTRGQGFDGHFSEGEVGYSVSDQDAKELADKIEMIISDYGAISKRCLESSVKFDWNAIADQYKNIYEEIRGN